MNLTRLYKTQSDDILAYCLLKSANLSNSHKELTEAKVPELKYDLMKDQLKKTFSDASKQIPTKKRNYHGRRYIFNWGFQSNDNRRINLMQNKNTILSHQQISSKQMIRNWILIGYLHNRSNYYNYNRRNIISRHYQQQPKVRSTQNNMKQIQQIQWWKNPGDRNGIQLRCHICESHHHVTLNCPEK